MSFLSSLFGGKKSRTEQVPRLSPQQMELMNKLLSGLGGFTGEGGGLDFLSKLASGDPEMFAEMEAPAMRQFGELQGDIASRFSGAGMGGQRSSGFQQAQSGAASELSEKLASNRMGMQQSAIQQLLGLSGQLLGTSPFENIYHEGSQGVLGSLLGGLGQFGGQAGSLGILKKFGLL